MQGVPRPASSFDFSSESALRGRQSLRDLYICFALVLPLVGTNI
jgi:hypothetical protein